MGVDGTSKTIRKNLAVLTAPLDTIKGAHKVLVETLGAAIAADIILQCPDALTAPAATIKGAHKALVETLGADRAAAAILQTQLQQLLPSVAGVNHR